MEPHRNHRAFRQKHRRTVSIDGLPVDVPLRNADEPSARSIGQRGESLQQFAKIVRMRVDGEDVHVKRQPEIVGDQEAVDPGRYIQRAIVFELDQHRAPGRRLAGEV